MFGGIGRSERSVQYLHLLRLDVGRNDSASGVGVGMLYPSVFYTSSSTR
jgi:hypothetical protein